VATWQWQHGSGTVPVVGKDVVGRQFQRPQPGGGLGAVRERPGSGSGRVAVDVAVAVVATVATVAVWQWLQWQCGSVDGWQMKKWRELDEY
jgi:hypothetical protein